MVGRFCWAQQIPPTYGRLREVWYKEVMRREQTPEGAGFKNIFREDWSSGKPFICIVLFCQFWNNFHFSFQGKVKYVAKQLVVQSMLCSQNKSLYLSVLKRSEKINKPSWLSKSGERKRLNQTNEEKDSDDRKLWYELKISKTMILIENTQWQWGGGTAARVEKEEYATQLWKKEKALLWHFCFSGNCHKFQNQGSFKHPLIRCI